jgi:hypothetical protein
MKTLLPSGQSTADLRNASEAAIAGGQNILLNPGDLLAILVALDLRVRLDPDVRLCATFAREQIIGSDPNQFNDAAVAKAAERVLKHEPLPDLSEAAS